VNVYGCGVVVFIRGKGSNASSISSLKKNQKKIQRSKVMVKVFVLRVCELVAIPSHAVINTNRKQKNFRILYFNEEEGAGSVFKTPLPKKKEKEKKKDIEIQARKTNIRINVEKTTEKRSDVQTKGECRIAPQTKESPLNPPPFSCTHIYFF
jgi:hypothetical protein